MTALASDPRAFPGAPAAGQPWRARLAVPLSIALHVGLLLALGRMAWHTAPTLPERAQFVWLGNALVLPPTSRTEPEAATDVAPVVRPPPPDVAVTEPPPAPAERIRHRAPAPPKTEIRRVRPESRDVSPAPSSEPRAAPPLPSGIDWAKERQRAAAGVIAQRQRDEAGRTFSLKDLLPPEAPPQDAPLVVVPTDHCAVVHGKLERFAMQMLGRCVRDADGEMFAAIKPDYLKSHPVCAAVADAPATFVDARGHEYSTIKCRLVLDE